MENDRSIFDRLDSIEKQGSINEAQNSEILSLLKDIDAKRNNPEQDVTKKPISEQERLATLKTFVKNSRKEFVWIGSYKEFSKSKGLLAIVCVGLIIMGILSSVVTTMSLGFYSTFTLFENLWLICECFILSYCLRAKKRMGDFDLSTHSCYKFIQDEDWTWVDTSKEKKRYRWFRRISYVAAIANLIVIWGTSSGTLAILATIAELAYIGLTVGAFFAYINLLSGYGTIVIFTGKQVYGDQIVSIVFDKLKKVLIPYEEFEEKYKFLLE